MFASPRRCDHHRTLRRVATASGGKAQPGLGGGPVSSHHQSLRQNGAGTDADLTEDQRGPGDLGLGLINEKLVTDSTT